MQAIISLQGSQLPTTRWRPIASRTKDYCGNAHNATFTRVWKHEREHRSPREFIFIMIHRVKVKVLDCLPSPDDYSSISPVIAYISSMFVLVLGSIDRPRLFLAKSYSSSLSRSFAVVWHSIHVGQPSSTNFHSIFATACSPHLFVVAARPLLLTARPGLAPRLISLPDTLHLQSSRCGVVPSLRVLLISGFAPESCSLAPLLVLPHVPGSVHPFSTHISGPGNPPHVYGFFVPSGVWVVLVLHELDAFDQ